VDDCAGGRVICIFVNLWRRDIFLGRKFATGVEKEEEELKGRIRWVQEEEMMEEKGIENGKYVYLCRMFTIQILPVRRWRLKRFIGSSICILTMILTMIQTMIRTIMWTIIQTIIQTIIWTTVIVDGWC